MEQVDQQRAIAQEARANDQAVLAGLWEQLIATCQWIQANNHAALAEAAQNRAEALTMQQDCVERDLHQQLAHTQNVVVDLQHEEHFLKNQLHPLLDEEEEDPEMFVEDDGWEEEEVDLEDEDDAISNLDSEHPEEQSHLVTSLKRQLYPQLCYIMRERMYATVYVARSFNFS